MGLYAFSGYGSSNVVLLPGGSIGGAAGPQGIQGSTAAAGAQGSQGSQGAQGSIPTTNVQIDSHYGAITTDLDGATVTFNMATSDKHLVVLGGSRTLAVSNDHVGQFFIIILDQGVAGNHTVTWWSNIRWAGGSPPTLTATASKQDYFTFLKIGSSSYAGFVSGQNV